MQFQWSLTLIVTPEHDSVTVDQIVTTLNENSKNAFRFIDQISRLGKIT